MALGFPVPRPWGFWTFLSAVGGVNELRIRPLLYSGPGRSVTPAARFDCVRYQHELFDMEMNRSIFDLAREMKNGPWIEACCEANRQKLRNRGVKESNRKDAHFKITQIRKFATAADAEGWVSDVTKAVNELSHRLA